MTQTPQQPTSSGFGPHTTASEVIAGIDLTGRVAVVTGGYSGIGLETTRVLAGAGATVWVPCRDMDRATAALADVAGDVRLHAMDLADLHSVRAFANAVQSTHPAVHLLINNAGIMACPETRVGPGWEAQFAVNHLGHVALTAELMPALEAADGARVVCLSSMGHRIAGILFDDIHFTSTRYSKWKAYGQSKTANSLFAVELDRRAQSKGIRAFAVHPGGIFTPLQRHLATEEMKALGWLGPDGEISAEALASFKSVEAGAATSVWCATSPALAGKGGVYCEDCDIAALVEPSSAASTGVRPWAVDRDAAARLWDVTQTMLQDA